MIVQKQVHNNRNQINNLVIKAQEIDVYMCDFTYVILPTFCTK